METAGQNNSALRDSHNEPLVEKPKSHSEDLKPTSKGVEHAKKRLRAFSIQKKSSLSPVPPPKHVNTTVGSVGTVFIGKLASSKPALKPGDIEEVVDPKKPPKPPKPGTSKLQNADYLNIQKKTLSEIEAMKRKMELVDLGIPLGLICPAPNSDKAMPTKAMPPIKSMLLARRMRVLHPIKKEAKKPQLKRNRTDAAAKNPAKVDEIIREAKQAKAEGKTFKFSYKKLLPSYQNPFQKKDKDKEPPPPLNDDHRQRDKRKYSDNFRRYSGHKDEKRSRDWHREGKDRMRACIIREREKTDKRSKDKLKKDVKSKERDEKSKDYVKTKDSKSKEKMDTINLSDEDDDDVQEVIDEIHDNDVKEANVNLKDFVVCDSWSENEDKKDPTPRKDEKNVEKDSNTTPIVKNTDPIEKLKQSLIKDEPGVEIKVEKLQPVTDSFKFEIEDDNDDEETMDMFAESTTTVKKYAKQITIPVARKKELYDSPVPMRFDYDASIDPMDESFLESIIAEIKQEDIDEDATQDKGLVEYDVSPKEDERESVTPELDDRIRELYSSRSDYSDGFKSVESVKSTESGFKSTESGCKSTESGFKSTESGYKSTESGLKLTESISKSNEDSLKRAEIHKLNESGYKSTDSSSKLTESDHKSAESGHKSRENETKSIESRQQSTKSGSTILKSIETAREEVNMSKSTVDSLETWSFVLKICQPLLFRHDKNKCYKETKCTPKIWFAENPKLCDCVRDRAVVYDELEMCKMELVDSVYGTEQVQEATYPEARGWYPAVFLASSGAPAASTEWEAEDSQERPTPPPHTRDEMVLDREYQKFMEAVWPEVEGSTKSETPRSTPVRELKKRSGEEPDEGKKKKVKLNEGKISEGKMSSEGWSQESEVEEDLEKINKKQKVDKVKRKRKHSTSISDSDGETPSKKKKKALKKEKKDKSKSKATKRQRLSKKYLKKLKEKQLKKKKKLAKLEDSDAEEQEREKKKKEKKLRKKKLLKHKKKTLKRKSKKDSSSSSSDSESDRKTKKKEKRKKHKKRKQSTSDSNQSEELFDVNILKNIKTERLTDDEKAKNFSPNKKHREIINVKQLQNDFVSIQIKKEIEDVNSPDEFEESFTEEEKKEMEKQEVENTEAEEIQVEKSEVEKVEVENDDSEKGIEVGTKTEENIEVKEKVQEVPFEEKDEHEFKEPEITRALTPQLKPQAEENLSQCSSQESIVSNKPYEKDDSHLRPSSQNSNYNFHDVMQNEGHTQENEHYVKGAGMEMEGDYEQGNYEMYEQMAMEYQSDVASQRVPPPDSQTSGRIETVVRARTRGEIKCDWRAGDPADPAPPRPSRWADPRNRPPATTANTTPQRPSRWGLKPSEVNIVLTGGGEGEQSEAFHTESAAEPAVYKIQSLANRTDNSNSGYDEAYMDMYGASDRLQYGDCFSRETTIKEVDKQAPTHHSSSLDDRINLALRTTILGDVAKDEPSENNEPDKGILVTKSLAETRSVKRVSFADGYKPGQDSDTEDPPVRKEESPPHGVPVAVPRVAPRPRVAVGRAAPPAPAAGLAPPPAPAAPAPPHLLRTLRTLRAPPLHHHHHIGKYDPNSLAAFMPPEPPPGLISF